MHMPISFPANTLLRLALVCVSLVALVCGLCSCTNPSTSTTAPAKDAATKSAPATVNATTATIAAGEQGNNSAGKAATTTPSTFPAGKWVSLFDGQTLTGWKVLPWAKAGKVYAEKDQLHLGTGDSGTGVVYTGIVPRVNYEIELDAMRAEGADFFCGMTVPVDKDSITLILGGWGGTMTGLSCLEFRDASDNETSQTIDYENGKWYRVRMRVTAKAIVVWLDEKKIISVDRTIENRKIGVRWEVEDCMPLGFATWRTHGALRDIHIRTLTPDELGEE